jgi:hypothetical protein
MSKWARSASIAVAVAGMTVVAGAAYGHGSSPARLRSATPIIYGYPYAPDCPAAGVAERVDRFGMYECNCTSYVAWALHVNGLRTDWFIRGAMDAWNWPHVARLSGLRVTASPSVGAVAVWPHLGGRLGHIAFVTGVSSGGRFSVAEYNLPSWLSATRLEFDLRSNVSPVGVQFIVVPASRE